MSVAVATKLRGKRICICAGSGGVGKTTISAALAIGLAARGARVAVVTIDPARRLAQSLGLAELGNEPRLVDPARFAAAGVQIDGELWAMMLDPKQTFDEMVARLAPDAGTREEVFQNRIYQQLSNAVAGSQEFSAVAKLHELHRDGQFDALVLDTPPSREPVEEAIYFRDQLRRHDMPFGGLIVNRVQPAELLLGDPARARGALAVPLGDRLAERVIANASDLRSLAERDRASIERLQRELGEPFTVLIEEQAADVYDLASLGQVAGALFAED